MRTTFLLVTACALSLVVSAQRYFSTESKVSFHSSTPVEDISATTTRAKAAIDTKSNRIMVKMKMVSFKFEKKLMEEHFNEKYVESEKYPDCVFKGEIVDSINYAVDGTHQVSAKGTLSLHGVTKSRTIKGTMTIKDGKITMDTNFKVALADHKIEVPKIVTKNIAEVIDVSAHFVCSPKAKK